MMEWKNRLNFFVLFSLYIYITFTTHTLSPTLSLPPSPSHSLTLTLSLTHPLSISPSLPPCSWEDTIIVSRGKVGCSGWRKMVWDLPLRQPIQLRCRYLTLVVWHNLMGEEAFKVRGGGGGCGCGSDGG